VQTARLVRNELQTFDVLTLGANEVCDGPARRCVCLVHNSRRLDIPLATVAKPTSCCAVVKQKAEQGSQQLQGEALELELEATLQLHFPMDGIEPIGKGEFGGDVLQRVFSPTGRPTEQFSGSRRERRIGVMAGLPSSERISALQRRDRRAGLACDSTGITMPCFAAEDQRRVPNQIHCARHMQVMPGALPRGQPQSLAL
jgi:hypothetical protein